VNWSNIIKPRKVLQALQIESHTLRIILKHGAPNVMPQFLGGLGDELLLTCVAHELKKRDDNIKIWQVSSAYEILLYNPDYHKVFSMGDWHLRYSNLLNSRRLKLRYSEMPIQGEYEVPVKEHILSVLSRKAGIKGQIEIRPHCHITEGEKVNFRYSGNQVVIQSVGPHSHHNIMRNKIWPHDRFLDLVKMIRSSHADINIIQIGSQNDLPLNKVLDLRGKTTLRESAAIISESDCFIGTSGLLSHLARAVDCRSVVIYGGREHSWQTGYICNENLDSFIDCAPCWHWNECDRGRVCMDMITAEKVFEAVEKVLAKKKTPLELQKVIL
jgi:hypothetical protein